MPLTFKLGWGPFDHLSTTGYSVYPGFNPITWSAKKQETVSIFSTEDTEDGTVLIFFHRNCGQES